MNCSLCGREFVPGERPYVKVTGWERPGRGQGGRSGSSIVLREQLSEVACRTCIARAQAGVDVQQMEIIQAPRDPGIPSSWGLGA